MTTTKRTHKPMIAVVDFDTATYVGSEEDVVDFAVAQGPDRLWYTSTVVDCNSAHFTNPLHTDDGPYRSEASARKAGREAAIEWCLENRVLYDEA